MAASCEHVHCYLLQLAALPLQSLTFKFTVQGRGGHAAMPHLNIDPVPAAAALVQALQVLVSRETSPLGSAVLSITQLQVCVTCYRCYVIFT
jgi:metal-dependent amidase/aminoacylase/carboxypeptidase family protein